MRIGRKSGKKKGTTTSPMGVVGVCVLAVGVAGALVVLAKLGKLAPLLKLGARVGGTMKKATGATQAVSEPVSHLGT